VIANVTVLGLRAADAKALGTAASKIPEYLEGGSREDRRDARPATAVSDGANAAGTGWFVPGESVQKFAYYTRRNRPNCHRRPEHRQSLNTRSPLDYSYFSIYLILIYRIAKEPDKPSSGRPRRPHRGRRNHSVRRPASPHP
jgi:hypothetical protein